MVNIFVDPHIYDNMTLKKVAKKFKFPRIHCNSSAITEERFAYC